MTNVRSIGGETVDFGDGVVRVWDLAVDPACPLESQVDALLEDMAQVAFDNGHVILDVGWYPQGSPDGCFRVMVVVGSDWQHPAYDARTRDIGGLRQSVLRALQIVGELRLND